jgi:nicotinamide phosphoribosyltransferase
LKEEILNREGTLVIRPDSGDPIRTLLEIFGILFETFGFTPTPKATKYCRRR